MSFSLSSSELTFSLDKNISVRIKTFYVENRDREGRRTRKKGACRNGQVFRFPNAVNLCHVQINYPGSKHNNKN